MGVVLSKRKTAAGNIGSGGGGGGGLPADVSVSAEKSSCGLTEYWTGKEQDFRRSYFNDDDREDGDAADGRRPAARASEFRMTTLLDEGAFGSVALTTHNATGAVYATKVIAKKKISKRGDLVRRVYNEKRIMESIDFRYVVRLEYFYQDHSFLYFVMPFVCGGNLFMHVHRHGVMTEDKARFYLSEVLLAVEYLHKLDLVHRDIKPENILLDVNGHAQLADFGFCKHVTGRTFTFLGTPEYIAPEIISGQGYGKSVDYWALGVLLYEMLAGRSPFADRDDETMYRNIARGRYSCPYGFTSDLINLLRGLFRVDVTRRYGNMANGVRDIKKHGWMRPVDWCATFSGLVPAPYVPTVSNVEDTSNFEPHSGRMFMASSHDAYGEEFKDF